MKLAHNYPDKYNLLMLLFGSALLFIGIRLELISHYASFIPYWDDWAVAAFLNKSLSADFSISDFYQAANEHRMVFNRLFSLLIFNANQHQWDPMILMTLNSALWALSGILLIRIALKHKADIDAPPLIAVIVLFWALPLSFVNILWGVQTHTYTMILFALAGCWYSGYRPFSAKWFLGIVALGAASLTLAGGTFAAFAVVAIQLIIFVSNRAYRLNALKTLVAALIMGGFGLSLILVQPNTVSSGLSADLTNQLTTLLKSLSWPFYSHTWPAFVMLSPILVLLIQSIRDKTTADPLIRFSLSLYAFIVIVALGIAYARGSAGIGPARRYFEFLALSSVASFMALLLIQTAKEKLPSMVVKCLVVSWLAVQVCAVPQILESVAFTFKDRNYVTPAQERIVRSYLNTRDASWLKNKPFRHVPFPHTEDFKHLLDDFNTSDILPYQIQTPPEIRPHENLTPEQIIQSTFVLNGTFSASSNTFRAKRFEENVFGSYNPRTGGQKTTGSFESTAVRIPRPYAVVPVRGYLGYEGLKLSLMNISTGKKYAVVPNQLDSSYAERWRDIFVKVPRGHYRLLAEDNNEKLWFSFATPRSVGRFSYFNQQLLNFSHWIWKLGTLLLVLACQKPLISVFIKKQLRQESQQ